MHQIIFGLAIGCYGGRRMLKKEEKKSLDRVVNDQK